MVRKGQTVHIPRWPVYSLDKSFRVTTSYEPRTITILRVSKSRGTVASFLWMADDGSDGFAEAGEERFELLAAK